MTFTILLKSISTQIAKRPLIVKALHTAWQAALGVIVAGIFTTHSSGDVKGLVIAASAAAASALKTFILGSLQGRRG